MSCEEHVSRKCSHPVIPDRVLRELGWQVSSRSPDPTDAAGAAQPVTTEGDNGEGPSTLRARRPTSNNTSVCPSSTTRPIVELSGSKVIDVANRNDAAAPASYRSRPTVLDYALFSARVEPGSCQQPIAVDRTYGADVPLSPEYMAAKRPATAETAFVSMVEHIEYAGMSDTNSTIFEDESAQDAPILSRRRSSIARLVSKFQLARELLLRRLRKSKL